MHNSVLYMAGQLGLDPPTMKLCSGGAAAETKQALKNCEAVANCYNCSLAGSSILFVIYCAASLSSGDRLQVQEQLQDFLKKLSAESLHDHSLSDRQEPVYLYILASNLPKRYTFYSLFKVCSKVATSLKASIMVMKLKINYEYLLGIVLLLQ